MPNTSVQETEKDAQLLLSLAELILRSPIAQSPCWLMTQLDKICHRRDPLQESQFLDNYLFSSRRSILLRGETAWFLMAVSGSSFSVHILQRQFAFLNVKKEISQDGKGPDLTYAGKQLESVQQLPQKKQWKGQGSIEEIRSSWESDSKESWSFHLVLHHRYYQNSDNIMH